MVKPNPLIAKCLRTGGITRFPSMAKAAEEGFSQSCISRVIRGVATSYAGYEWTTTAPIRPSQRSEYRANIKALHAQGKGPVEIAQLLGCSHSTVHYHIRKVS